MYTFIFVSAIVAFVAKSYAELGELDFDISSENAFLGAMDEELMP